jgi:hypothetical protein
MIEEGAVEWGVRTHAMIGLPTLRALSTPRTAAAVRAAVELREQLENDRDFLSELLAGAVHRASEPNTRRLFLQIRRDLFNLRLPPTPLVEDAFKALAIPEADRLRSFLRNLDHYVATAAEGEEELSDERTGLEIAASAFMRNSTSFLLAVALSSPTLYRNLMRYFERLDQRQPRDKIDRRTAQKGLVYLLRATTKAGAWTWFASVDLGLRQSVRSHVSSVRVNAAFAELERLNSAQGNWRGNLILNPYLWSDARGYTVVSVSKWIGDSRCVVPREWQVTRIRMSKSIRLIVEMLRANGGVAARGCIEAALADAAGDQSVSSTLVRRLTDRLLDIGVLLPEPSSNSSLRSGTLSIVATREVLQHWHELGATGRAQIVAACSAHTARVVARSPIHALNMGPPLYEQVFCSKDCSSAMDTRLLRDCFSLRRLLPLLDDQTFVRCVMTDLFVAQHGAGGATSDVLGWLLAWRKTCGTFADRALVGGDLTERPHVGERGNGFLAAYERFVCECLPPANRSGEAEVQVSSLGDLPPTCLPAIDCWAFALQPFLGHGGQLHAVLDLVTDGLGNQLARYLDDLSPREADSMQRRLAGRLTDFGMSAGGELVTLSGHFGFGANTQQRLTRRELALPGDVTARVREGTALTLADLLVRHNPHSDTLELLDRKSGVRILPCWLGALGRPFLPALHRDLLLLGWCYASRLSLAHRLRPGTTTSPIVETPRLTHKRLVLSRRRWLFPTVPDELLVAGGNQSFATLCVIERWRRSIHMPSQVFAHRPASADSRPRFLDFTNAYSLPHVLRVLAPPGPLALEEALPNPMAPEEHTAKEVQRVWGFVTHRSSLQAPSGG